MNVINESCHFLTWAKHCNDPFRRHCEERKSFCFASHIFFFLRVISARDGRRNRIGGKVTTKVKKQEERKVVLIYYSSADNRA